MGWARAGARIKNPAAITRPNKLAEPDIGIGRMGLIEHLIEHLLEHLLLEYLRWSISVGASPLAEKQQLTPELQRGPVQTVPRRNDTTSTSKTPFV
jgi:hypothetical protein